MTVPLTGLQYEIEAGQYRATVTELGAGLRELVSEDNLAKIDAEPARIAAPMILSAGLFTDPLNPAFPSGNLAPVFNVRDNFVKIRGAHTIKAGFTASRTQPAMTSPMVGSSAGR